MPPVDEREVSRLCEIPAPGGARYECGGAPVVVEALDLDPTGATVVVHDGPAYTDEEITVFGELVDGVLVLDPWSAERSGYVPVSRVRSGSIAKRSQ